MDQTDWTNLILGGVVGSLFTLLVAWSRSLYAGILLFFIARKRGEGIVIRNRGQAEAHKGGELKVWLQEAGDWERSVPSVVRWLSISEARRIQDLDRPGKYFYPEGAGKEQKQLLANMSATIKRLDSLLERHEPKY